MEDEDSKVRINLITGVNDHVSTTVPDNPFCSLSLKNLRNLLVKLGECAVDCDVDRDCKKGLLCAAAHTKELIAAGFDKRKAYCGQVGTRYQEVCYNASLVPKPKIKECEVNCFVDSDCEEYLLCGRTNKAYLNYFYDFYLEELTGVFNETFDEFARSVNEHDAYCGDVTKRNEYVCFDRDFFLSLHY